MLVAERRSRIVEAVRSRGAVTIGELAEELDVSPMTVRRDVELLADAGEVEKVRGGATRPGSATAEVHSTGAGARVHAAEKRAIARRAAELVRPGMSVGLSGGTTTWTLAHEIRDVENLTIVTNALPVAELFRRPDRADEPYTQTVVLTGGVRTPSDALVGPVAVRSLEHLHLDVVFLGAHGVDLHAGLTTSNLLEAETDRAFLAAGHETVVLADHTKWGAVALTTIADLDDVDRLVTDDGLADDVRARVAPAVRELWVAAVGGEQPTV